MAAKDADLAYEYTGDFLYLHQDTSAALEIVLDNGAAEDPVDNDLFVYTTDGITSPGVTYRMRGFDTNGAVNDYVFWDSGIEDPTGPNYSGPGPLIDIVTFAKIGGGA